MSWADRRREELLRERTMQARREAQVLRRVPLRGITPEELHDRLELAAVLVAGTPLDVTRRALRQLAERGEVHERDGVWYPGLGPTPLQGSRVEPPGSGGGERTSSPTPGATAGPTPSAGPSESVQRTPAVAGPAGAEEEPSAGVRPTSPAAPTAGDTPPSSGEQDASPAGEPVLDAPQMPGGCAPSGADDEDHGATAGVSEGAAPLRVVDESTGRVAAPEGVPAGLAGVDPAHPDEPPAAPAGDTTASSVERAPTSPPEPTVSVPHRTDPEFGPWLRAERVRRQLTQPELLRLAGLDARKLQSKCSQWERGVVVPSAAVAEQLVAALSISPPSSSSPPGEAAPTSGGDPTRLRRTAVPDVNLHRASSSGTSTVVDRWSAGCQVLVDETPLTPAAPATEDTTEWHDGPLWVHQREQIDRPVPAGWWVCHQHFEGPDSSGSRRVAVGQHRGEAHARGRANALRWPHPQDVPDEALGYPPAPRYVEPDALTQAADEIARLCGCPTWDYPAQLVRDVRALVDERDALRLERDSLRSQHESWRCHNDAVATFLGAEPGQDDEVLRLVPAVQRIREPLEAALGAGHVAHLEAASPADLTLPSLADEAERVIVELRKGRRQLTVALDEVARALGRDPATVTTAQIVTEVHELVVRQRAARSTMRVDVQVEGLPDAMALGLLEELRDRASASGLNVPLRGGVHAFAAYLIGWLEAHGVITAPTPEAT